jgi:plasmid stabilization system protein ParE
VTVNWRPAALSDVARIARHIAFENPIAAGRVARELLLAGDSLEIFPRRGRPGDVPGTRELLACPPYILIYRLSGADVTVLRVWHGAQSRER